MFSFTIAAVVLVTGIANELPYAGFQYVENELKFETREECEEVRRLTHVNFLTAKAHQVQGWPSVSECKEVK